MIIECKKIAENIYKDMKIEVEKMEIKPWMAVILVWENPSSLRYIEQKRKWAEYVWIKFDLIKYSENVKEIELLNKIKDLNKDKNINWFIVQLPLPNHINEKNIINEIDPKKDIDGFSPENIWKIMIWDTSWFIPCTPAWIMEIIKNQNINLEWKVVCVIWRSNIVGKPIASLLINAWATLISCNSKTKNLKKYTSISDIVIVAAWKVKLLKVDMLKMWSIVIDVGFTVINWEIFWDADTEIINLAWNKITPVPGWVWVLTVCMLMQNVIKSYKIQKNLKV